METINYEKLVFHCNSCGETYDPYQREYVDGIWSTYKDISPDELPAPLRVLYEKFQTDRTGSLCYIVTYDERPGILLNNEYDKSYADDIGLNDEDYFQRFLECATHMEVLLHDISSDIHVLVGRNTGCDECHELAAFLPDTLSDEQMIRAFYICDGAAYSKDFVPNYNGKKYIDFRNMMRCDCGNMSNVINPLQVDVPGIGTLLVKDVGNREFPGIAVDLLRPDGSSIGLANIQKGDEGRLQAVLFAELGTDEYTHCIDYVNAGEAPVEDVDKKWSSRITRAEMANISDAYNYLVQEETVVNRMIEAGYCDPKNNYPKLLSDIVNEFRKNLSYGCEEAWSLDTAMKLAENDKTKEENF